MILNKLTKLTAIIRLFGLTKVAMIYYCRPKVIQSTDELLETSLDTISETPTVPPFDLEKSIP